MSEQPEAWRTDPRERLIESIDSTWAHSVLGATPEQLVDAYAHKLAERQRAHAGTLESYSGLYDGDQLHSLPDLIDPQESACPVRSDEEQA